MRDWIRLLLHIFCICPVQCLMMYQAPLPKNVTLGSSVTFTCNVSGNTGMFWLVDEESHNDVTVKARGISSQDHYDSASDSTRSILTVTCDEQNNNTLLQCVGHNNGQIVKSSTVVLLIQGYLGAVSELIGIQTTSNQALFNWSKPHSLEGVPVIGYKVQVAVRNRLNEDMGLWINVTVNGTSYATTSPPAVACGYLNVTVHAVNNVGIGEPASYDFTFLESPVKANWTMVDIHKQYLNNELHLVSKLEAGIHCMQAIPSLSSLVLNDENMMTGTCNVSGSDDIEVDEDSTVLTLVITINCSSSTTDGSTYTGDLILTNIGGSCVIPGIEFDTNVLTDVSIATGSAMSGKICIICWFFLDVHSKYCSVSLKYNEIYSYNLKIFQEDGSKNGTACITGLATGVYSILVCNVACNINRTSQLTFAYHNLSVIGIEPSATKTSFFLHINSLHTSIPLASPTPNERGAVFLETRTAKIIFSSAGMVILLGVAVFIFSVIVICLLMRKAKWKKMKANFMVSRNEAYSSVYVRRESNQNLHAFEVNSCSAYGVLSK